MWKLLFEGGTLVLEPPRQYRGGKLPESAPKDLLQWDKRIGAYRALAHHYRPIKTWLHRSGIDYDDRAGNYTKLELNYQFKRTPRPYQREAIEAWKGAGKRGIVVLPTGTGKSFVAELAILETQRSTLVVAPTIDLMIQWAELLSTSFDLEVGMLGGGQHQIRELTVSTYDSAHLHIERYGDRFGLLIFDEVHHLPSPSYLSAAECAVAPFRLGLTATLERSDGRHNLLEEVLGPVVYRRSIREMAGKYLADYETVQISVELTPREAEAYRINREIYRDFLREKELAIRSPEGWNKFIFLSSRSKAGRRAMRAYRKARQIALSSPSKLKVLGKLLRRHRKDQVLIFTNDNETVYRISQLFLIPALTHQTEAKERRAILKKFNGGEYPCIITSRVLNEGVDIPKANVAIVLSGTGSTREHVQRLGRILRPAPGKRAFLYEVITSDTIERFVSARRREHDAYRG